MIVYNITVNIHESVHDQWMQWTQNTYIPEFLATGKFSSARLVKVLVEEEMGGITYSLQFHTTDRATLKKFLLEDADRIDQDAYRLFADKMLTFKTELEIISEH